MTIDFLMPFYGEPAQLQEAVRSVLNQHDSDWRLVVLNDCYPDWDPGPWLSGLNDPRIVSLRNTRNLGVNGSFERCIDLAESDYAVILGCDDKLLPNFLTTVRSLIQEFNQPDYVQPGVQVINIDGLVVSPLGDRVKSWIQPHSTKPVLLSGESLVVSLMRGNWTYFPAICWRVDRLRQFRFKSDYEIALDLGLQLDILLDGGSFAYSPEVAFQYRRHQESASSYTADDGSRFEEEERFFVASARQLNAMGWERGARAARRHLTSRLHAVSKVPAALRNNDLRALRALLRHALRVRGDLT